MRDAVSICNNSLARLGQSPFNAFSDNNSRARRCQAVYEDLKLAVLREGTWNCAMSKISLVPEATPSMGLTKYSFPNNVVRIIRVWFGDYTSDLGSDPRYTREGNSILMEGVLREALNLRFINGTTQESLFDQLLLEALVVRIAAELSYSFINSSALKQALMREYAEKLIDAKTVESQENREPTLNTEYMFTDFERSRNFSGPIHPAANVSAFDHMDDETKKSV